jgi:hypothetical protein
VRAITWRRSPSNLLVKLNPLGLVRHGATDDDDIERAIELPWQFAAPMVITFAKAVPLAIHRGL